MRERAAFLLEQARLQREFEEAENARIRQLFELELTKARATRLIDLKVCMFFHVTSSFYCTYLSRL